MVAIIAGRREQIFVPESDFGGGWEGIALVMEGFGFGDGWARTTNGQPRLEAVGRLPWAIAPVHRAADVGNVVVQEGSKGGWFQKLDRARVGRVGFLGEKGLDMLVVANWVHRW